MGLKEECKLRDLSGREFSKEEYNMLRQEQNMRLEMIHNHGFTLASIILVFFSAILVIVGEIFNLALKDNSIIGKNIISDSAIILSIAIFCLFPVILIYCFSSKYEDNLRQVASVGAYQRVFYEFPTYIKSKDSKDESSKILAWELFHLNSAVPKAKLITAEYAMISYASIFLSFIIGVALFCCSYISNNFFQKDIARSVVTAVISILIFAVVLALSIYISIKTRHNTKTDTILSKYSKTYFDEYCHIAVVCNFLTTDEIIELKQLVNALRERDDKLKI